MPADASRRGYEEIYTGDTEYARGFAEYLRSVIQLIGKDRFGPEERELGWTTQTVMMADVGLNLVLTGQKSWHGFAPFIGASMGIAIGGDVPADSLSGYEFNTKFIVTPAIGFRWHPIRRIGLRVECLANCGHQLETRIIRVLARLKKDPA